MNGESECKALVQYATKLFSASAEPWTQLLPLEEDIFALPRWRRAMARLKPEKAARNMTPPLRNWKQHSEKILPQLQKLATHHLCCAEWTEVQLAWLAKPKKCPSSPANLRTVGLMSGDTKLFNMVLKEAVQEYVTPGLIDIPQFAYRKLSSTVDALLRGSLHCSKVRAMLGEVNTDVTTRLTTDQLPVLTGGVMISLDLAKAFDCLPFREMYDSLRCIDVPDNLARLVVVSHRQSICIVRHAGHSAKNRDAAWFESMPGPSVCAESLVLPGVRNTLVSR